jgi:hypothetical protein
VLNQNRLYRLVRDKNSNLLDPFLSYEESGVLWTGPNKLQCCITIGWKGLSDTNTLAFWSRMLVMKINRGLLIRPQFPELNRRKEVKVLCRRHQDVAKDEGKDRQNGNAVLARAGAGVGGRLGRPGWNFGDRIDGPQSGNRLAPLVLKF